MPSAAPPARRDTAGGANAKIEPTNAKPTRIAIARRMSSSPNTPFRYRDTCEKRSAARPDNRGGEPSFHTRPMMCAGKCMPEAVIVEAVRTPIGKRGGSLKDWRPDDLAAFILRALADRTGSE